MTKLEDLYFLNGLNPSVQNRIDKENKIIEGSRIEPGTFYREELEIPRHPF